MLCFTLGVRREWNEGTVYSGMGRFKGPIKGMVKDARTRNNRKPSSFEAQTRSAEASSEPDSKSGGHYRKRGHRHTQTLPELQRGRTVTPRPLSP